VAQMLVQNLVQGILAENGARVWRNNFRYRGTKRKSLIVWGKYEMLITQRSASASIVYGTFDFLSLDLEVRS